MSRHIQRVQDQIKKEIGRVILNEIRDPRIGFITVSRVEVTNDLAYADVFVSVMGPDKERESSLHGLASSSSYIRKHLSKNMQTRTVPQLRFILDTNLDHSERINELLSGMDLGEAS